MAQQILPIISKCLLTAAALLFCYAYYLTILSILSILPTSLNPDYSPPSTPNSRIPSFMNNTITLFSDCYLDISTCLQTETLLELGNLSALMIGSFAISSVGVLLFSFLWLFWEAAKWIGVVEGYGKGLGFSEREIGNPWSYEWQEMQREKVRGQRELKEKVMWAKED